MISVTLSFILTSSGILIWYKNRQNKDKIYLQALRITNGVLGLVEIIYEMVQLLTKDRKSIYSIYYITLANLSLLVVERIISFVTKLEPQHEHHHQTLP